MIYSFEIQNCFKIYVDATDKESGRQKVMEMLHEGDFAEKFNEDVYVSQGTEEPNVQKSNKN